MTCKNQYTWRISMINKINNVNFNGSYIKKSNNVNIKRGLKAAGIFASSTLAATFSLMACKSCIDSHKKTDIQNTNPIGARKRHPTTRPVWHQ